MCDALFLHVGDIPGSLYRGFRGLPGPEFIRGAPASYFRGTLVLPTIFHLGVGFGAFVRVLEVFRGLEGFERV